MDQIYKTLAVAVKDLRTMLTDRAYMISMFILPLVIGIFSASMSSEDGGGIHLPAILVNQDQGSYGQSIPEILRGVEELDLLEMDSPTQAQEQVSAGEYLAAVIIPVDFTQRIDAYQPAEISVIVDPAQATYGRILTTIMEEIAGAMAIQGEIRYGIHEVLSDMGYDESASPEVARAAQAQVEGVLFTQMQRMEVDSPILLRKDTIQGDQVFVWDSLYSLVLPSLTVMFAFFIVPAVAVGLLREREEGTLRRLVAAPLPRSALIGGKVIAPLLLVLVQVGLIFGIGALVFDMSLGQSPTGFLLVTVSLGLVATTLGLLVAAIARSIDQAGSISMLVIFGFGILGGGLTPTFPLYRGEGFLALVSRLTPQAQAQMGYLNLFIHNSGVADVLPQSAYMLGLALLFFLVAVWRFKFE
jgi:ABC-2 type transport system permease protein